MRTYYTHTHNINHHPRRLSGVFAAPFHEVKWQTSSLEEGKVLAEPGCASAGQGEGERQELLKEKGQKEEKLGSSKVFFFFSVLSLGHGYEISSLATSVKY